MSPVEANVWKTGCATVAKFGSGGSAAIPAHILDTDTRNCLYSSLAMSSVPGTICPKPAAVHPPAKIAAPRPNDKPV